jgi:TolA-binding protein
MKIEFILAVIVLFIFGCSKQSDKSYFDSAQKNIKENKFAEAVKNFEELFHEYPESPYASKSIYEIARIYQGLQVKNMKSEESFSLAVKNYKLVFDKYPKSSEAPMALFMAGYIQANELKKYEEATATYNRFLKEFSNHDLAKSAQEELNNMGLSPEEILAKKVTAK